MKTVIVPVDFSATSVNAAHYAAKLLERSYDTGLILYHMYEKKDHEASANKELEGLKNELARTSPLRIETIAVHGGDLIDEIERVVHHRHSSLVVMGITGRTGLEQVFIGSNTLKLIERNITPVLVVPPGAAFKDVKNVALTSDFKDVRMTTPSVPIKSLLELFRPVLHIVNVDSGHYVSITEEYQKEKAILQQMFSDYRPEFYFIGRYDFFEAIQQFTNDKSIDILITIPRRHSFWNGIFKGHHTKKLVYHSHVPVLAVHE